jgi:hypothetical protein
MLSIRSVYVRDILIQAEKKIQALVGYPVNVRVKGSMVLDAVTMDMFCNEAASLFGTTVPALKSPSRKRELVAVRQALMAIYLEYSSKSLKAIGDYFGGRDHTTVIHSKDTLKDLIDTGDPLATTTYSKIFQLVEKYDYQTKQTANEHAGLPGNEHSGPVSIGGTGRPISKSNDGALCDRSEHAGSNGAQRVQTAMAPGTGAGVCDSVPTLHPQRAQLRTEPRAAAL